jgi:hypothetical protein
MVFIQPCFIRKNTPELRKKLEELGVNYDGFYGIENECIVTGYGPYNNTYHTLNHPPIGISYYTRQYGPMKFKCIDCGTNEELFLALATLRDDTDKNQWFIYNSMDCIIEKLRTIDWFICNENSIEDCACYDSSYLNCHKATVEEIIEHFKKQ